MRPVPPVPPHGPTPPMPSWVPTTWKGSRPGAVPITHERDSLSSPPGETARRRQGDATGNRRAGPVREEGGGWVYAPASSHISRMRMDPLASPLTIQVIFKGPDGVGEVAEFIYYFADKEAGTTIFDELRRSSHPYGSVLYPSVIKAGIPYHPLSRS